MNRHPAKIFLAATLGVSLMGSMALAFAGRGGGGGARGGGFSGGGFRGGNVGGYRPGGNFGGYRPGGNFGGYRPNVNVGGYRPNANVGGYHPATGFPAGGYRPSYNTGSVNRGNFNNNAINRPVNINSNVNRLGGNNFRNANINRTNNFTNVNVNNNGYRRPYYPYHSNWVNGTWPGHYGGYGGNRYGYGNRYGVGGWGYGLGGLGLGLGLGYGLGGGLGYGLGGWGYNPYSYGWGYSNYSNPFYGTGAQGIALQPTGGVPITTTAYDYSLPIDTAAAVPDQPVIQPAMDAFDAARAAFKANNYSEALGSIDQAIKATPNDANAHEFRGVTLFALGRYRESATALYPVLSAGPGWDWTTLISLYPDVDTYTSELRALETFRNQNPNDSSARFVLGYLYTGQGSLESASREYSELAKILPNDSLVKRLARITTEDKSAEPTTDTPPADPTPATPTIPPVGEIVGTWKASPNADSTIVLTRDAAGAFTWDVTSKGQSKPIKGTSSYQDDVLALSQKDGPPLAGKITWNGPNKFNFRLVGNGDDDPGLNFSK